MVDSVRVFDVETPALDRDQQRRADALKVARELVRQGNTAISTRVDVIDMVSVAQFILTGEDPWPAKPAGWEVVEAALDDGCKCDPDALGVE